MILLQKRNFIYCTPKDVEKAGNIIKTGVQESRRYLLRKDGMGFTMTETIMKGGDKEFMKYDNHLEAVFITQGRGWIELVDKKEDFGKGKRYGTS